MNRITVQSGYELPFDEFGRVRGTPKRKHRPHRQTTGMKKQQDKMKACAREWRGSKRGSYRSFMSACLKK